MGICLMLKSWMPDFPLSNRKISKSSTLNVHMYVWDVKHMDHQRIGLVSYCSTVIGVNICIGINGIARISVGGGGEFSKICKRFLMKIAKMHYFSIFFKKFKNHALIFLGLDEKHKFLGHFWENFVIFWWKWNGKIEF